MCMSIGRIRDRRIYTCLGTGLLAAVGDDTLPAIHLIASPNRHCSQRPPLLKCPQLMMMPGIQIDTQHGCAQEKEWPIVHARRFIFKPATAAGKGREEMV